MAKEDIIKKDIITELKDMESENDQSHLEPVNVVIGRYQPFTIGHLGMAKELEKINGLPSVYIYIRSKSGKNSKFSDNLTINYMDDIAKGQDLVRDAWSMTGSFIPVVVMETQRRGYNPVLIGAGEDRAKTYTGMAKRMKNITTHPDFAIQELKGRLTSGTEVRQAIIDGDEKKFKKFTPKQIHPYYKQLKDELEDTAVLAESVDIESVVMDYDLDIDTICDILESYGEDLFSDALIVESILDYELNEKKSKKQTFSEYLKDLDDRFVDGINAIKGQNGSDVKLENRQSALHSLSSIFRNYISSLQKEYGRDKNQLTFIKEQAEIHNIDILSLEEAIKYKKGDKLKIKLKNGKEFDLTFDSYMNQKGMAFGKFKDENGELDVKSFSLDSIVKESLNESKIKYKKGKTYQSGHGWTVYKNDDEVHFSIEVDPSSGWSTDPHYTDEMRLMDSGKRKATYRIKSGNIEKQAKEMFDIGTKENNEYYGLTYKDYADIIRLSIDMQNAINMNESELNEKIDFKKAFKFIKKKLKLKNIEQATNSIYRYVEEYLKDRWYPFFKSIYDEVEIKGVAVDYIQDVIHIEYIAPDMSTYNKEIYEPFSEAIPLPKYLQENMNEAVKLSPDAKKFVKGLEKIKLDKKFADAWMPGNKFVYLDKSDDTYHFIDYEGDVIELNNIETLKHLKKSLESMNEGRKPKLKFKKDHPTYMAGYGQTLNAITDYIEENGYFYNPEEFFASFGDAFFKPKKGKTQRKTITIYQDKESVKPIGNLHISIYNRGVDGNTYELTTYHDQFMGESEFIGEEKKISRKNFLKLIKPLKVFLKNNTVAKEDLYDLIKKFYGENGVEVFENLYRNHNQSLNKSNDKIFEKILMFRNGTLELENDEKEFIPFLSKISESKLQKFKEFEYDSKITESVAKIFETDSPLNFEEFKDNVLESDFIKRQLKPFLMIEGLNDYTIEKLVEGFLKVKHIEYCNYFKGNINEIRYEGNYVLFSGTVDVKNSKFVSGVFKKETIQEVWTDWEDMHAEVWQDDDEMKKIDGEPLGYKIVFGHSPANSKFNKKAEGTRETFVNYNTTKRIGNWKFLETVDMSKETIKSLEINYGRKIKTYVYK